MPSSTSNSEAADIRRFAAKTLLFLGMQGVLALAILVPFLIFAPDTYIAELADKQRRLETVAAPRLVLVGSSNLAFSFDSVLAGEQLKLAPVNQGLHLGLGLQFVLNATAPNVRAGDLVVLAPEYSHFIGDMSTDTLAESLLTAPRATLAGLDYHVFQRLADETLAMMGRRTRTLLLMGLGVSPARPQAPYRHDSFNQVGDVVAHRNLETIRTRPLGRKIVFDPWKAEDVIESLNNFAEGCRRRGATVVLSCPPYPRTEYERDQAELDKLYQAMIAHLHLEVISSPADTVYPDDCFYDTEYHLLQAGVSLRTQLVVSRLKQHTSLARNSGGVVDVHATVRTREEPPATR